MSENLIEYLALLFKKAVVASSGIIDKRRSEAFEKLNPTEKHSLNKLQERIKDLEF